jgi:outer membrane protein
MRGTVITVALAMVLSAGSAVAMGQTTQPKPAPTQPAPKPATPPTQTTPTQPAPGQPAPTTQPAQPQPPAPFPAGAKIAYINLPVVAQSSTDGRAASTKIEDLQKKKQAELADKNKQLQAAQQKLAQGGTVLADAARRQLEKDIDRLQREIQSDQQNAQAEVQELTQDLQEQFRQKLIPIIEQIGKERDLLMIFSVADAGMIWANPGLDLTQEVVRRLDQNKPAATTPKQ